MGDSLEDAVAVPMKESRRKEEDWGGLDEYQLWMLIVYVDGEAQFNWHTINRDSTVINGLQDSPRQTKMNHGFLLFGWKEQLTSICSI